MSTIEQEWTAIVNIKHTKGNTFAETLTISKNKEPINITGAVFMMTIRATPDSAIISIQQAWIIQSTSLWIFSILISSATMDWLERWDYFYDIEMVKSGVKDTIVKGRFINSYVIT